MITPQDLEHDDRLLTAARNVIRAQRQGADELTACLQDLKTALQPWQESEYDDYWIDVETRLNRPIDATETQQIDRCYADGYTTRQAVASLSLSTT